MVVMKICNRGVGAAIALVCAATMQAQQTPQTPTATPPAATTPAQQTAPAAPADQNAPATLQQHPDEPHTVIPVFVNEVDLIFTVLDKAGNFVNGLQQQNFGLLDDGRPPARVLKF